MLEKDMSEFEFTNNWFQDSARANWDQLVPQINPARILEIGSFEGASTCYMLQKTAGDTEIHCVDTWEGGIEHDTVDMNSVEQRFDRNVAVATSRAAGRVNLVKHKGFSDLMLARLLAEGKRNYFDWIYVDGSHQAPDVLFDAVASFRLLRVGGMLVFDDYLWAENLPTGKDPIRCPKPAIDAFTNLYCRKLQLLSAPLYQLYAIKLSD